MRVLVCGGRAFNDKRFLFYALDVVRRDRGLTTVICGAQRQWSEKDRMWIGADWLAIEWALDRQVPFIGHPAEWKVLGRAAGPNRNARMPVWWDPGLGVAFPGGSGTEGMVKILEDRDIEVIRPEPYAHPMNVHGG